MRIRPWPRATMSRTARFARWTVARTFRSTVLSSSARSDSANGPLTPIPAFSAIASTGRPVAVIAAPSASTPSGVARSTCTASTCTPMPRSSWAAAESWSSSAATIRSKPWAANCLASSRPMPLEAPVTTARGREESMLLASPPSDGRKRARSALDQLAQQRAQLAVVLGPERRGDLRRQRRRDLAPRDQLVGAGGRQADQVGAPVVRIAPPLDEPARLRLVDDLRDHRRADGEPGGERLLGRGSLRVEQAHQPDVAHHDLVRTQQLVG